MDPRIRRYFWQRPRTHREIITERRISFLELFYDLIYVVLIARVAEGLHGSITGERVATFVVMFGLLWVGWFNGTVLHDAHGRPDVRNRLLTFLQMFAIAVMAVFAPTAGAAGGFGFAISYTVFLLILLGQWYRVARIERHDPLYGPIARRYTFLLAVMTVLLAASIFVPAGLRVWIWGGLLMLYLIGMVATALLPRPDADTARQSADPMATDSLLERYGLFMIIVLGEVVASVVAGLGAVDDLTPRVFLTGFAGLAVGIAFWWTYFDMVGMRPPRRATKDVYLYTLAQLPLTLAITGVGAATVSLIEHTEGSDPAASWTFAGFVALAMLSLGAIAPLLRDWETLQAMFGPATQAGYAVAVLALALAALGAPALVLTGVLFLAMCGQWLYAVRGWLRTPEGKQQVDAADLPPPIAGQ
ncbi:MAG: low temperature requirement protein A [Propionicimonas sp.]